MRRHLAEQVGLVPKALQIRQAVTAVDQCHRQLREHDAAIVTARPLRRAAHRDRHRPREAQPVGELGHEQSREPTWLTTPSPLGVTVTGCAARIFFISEVPSWVGMLWRRQHQFPLLGGRFRGCATANFR